MTERGSKPESFVFFLSCDINYQVRLRVEKILGSFRVLNADAPGGAARPSSLYATADLCSSGNTLCLSTRTPYAESSGDGASWGAFLQFPVKFRDLSKDTQLAITVWERAEGHDQRALGGTTLRLFSKKGRLKTGRQVLKLWLGRQADILHPTGTPAKVPVAARGEIGRVEQVLKQYNRGEIPHVDWMDHLMLAKIDQMREKDLRSTSNGHSKVMLEIELPEFPHAVIYQQAAVSSGPNPTAATGGLRAMGSGEGASDGRKLIILQDPEVGWDNPSEKKAQKLARSAARGLADRDLKPDTEERRRISALLLYPPNRPLSSEDRALVWRFRWNLTGEKRALTKVLQSVDWADAQEARQGIELLGHWVAIDVADALELLSPAFLNPEVRAYAVEVLKRTDDEELRYYLLQLVQALRFEAVDDGRLANFIVYRASRNPVLGILLHWYLYTEWEDPNFGPRAAFVHKKFQDAHGSAEILSSISSQMGLMAKLRHIVTELKNVRGGAVRKADKLREMLNDEGQCGDLQHLLCPLPLDPSVHLAGILPQDCSVFKSALAPLRLTFRTAGSSSGDSSTSPSPTTENTALPTTAVATAAAAAAAAAAAVSTAAAAAVLPADEGRYMVIYKRGDDLRQDQLVVQMFSLMDRLLKRENLDLRLTPYRVLPTSSEDGLIECVPSVALARVLADHKTINRFFAINNADPAGPLGLKAEVVDTFVRSCAGYCVMTYILGVGDRHLDNLMLTNDGRLFHIDFGYIMGRDPKPFPPPMKLNKEMIDAMGGADSDQYRKFRTLACEAYNILRKSASLLVSLFHLMAGASIPDVQSDPEKAMLKLQEKLRLDVDEETAVGWMQQLINESSSALMPAIMEQGHRIAQYWR